MVKLIFLKCIFKFLIKTASPTSNYVNDRQIWFELNNFTCSIIEWQRGSSGIGVVRYQPVVMLQVQITVARNFFLSCRFFVVVVLFSEILFVIFLPFSFLLALCIPSMNRNLVPVTGSVMKWPHLSLIESQNKVKYTPLQEIYILFTMS